MLCCNRRPDWTVLNCVNRNDPRLLLEISLDTNVQELKVSSLSTACHNLVYFRICTNKCVCFNSTVVR